MELQHCQASQYTCILHYGSTHKLPELPQYLIGLGHAQSDLLLAKAFNLSPAAVQPALNTSTSDGSQGKRKSLHRQASEPEPPSREAAQDCCFESSNHLGASLAHHLGTEFHCLFSVQTQIVRSAAKLHSCHSNLAILQWVLCACSG